MFFDVKGRFLQICKKKYIFKVPKIFENVNFAARAAEVADFFGIKLIKIYLIDRNVSLFENRKKVQNHSNLLYFTVHVWGPTARVAATSVYNVHCMNMPVLALSAHVMRCQVQNLVVRSKSNVAATSRVF